MSKYDDLFDATAPDDSVFVDKAALDPLTDPEEIVARDDQEHDLATLLNGIHDGYLPPTVSLYGPPGTGKTLTTRRVCREFAARHDQVAVEYVNLKECRTLFAAANEILYELTGAKKKAYEGLDGVFTAIWDALADYPDWTILLLDEIDHVRHDSNYDPNEFFYRLLRGEERLARDISLSVWLLSNELLEVDLRLDSRVQSAMSDEQVFFPPYDRDDLAAVLAPRCARAFREGALPEAVFDHAVDAAARRWGDARKALTLVRQAGETANDRGRAQVTTACIDGTLEAPEHEAVTEKLLALPFNHFHVLTGITGRIDRRSDEVIQPVTTADIRAHFQGQDLPAAYQLGERMIRQLVTDLETMGLVDTWIESHGRDGRAKQIETTFDPRWVHDAMPAYADASDVLPPDQAE